MASGDNHNSEPVGVVIDCSLAGGLDADARERMVREAKDLLFSGHQDEASGDERAARRGENKIAGAKRLLSELGAAEAKGPAATVVVLEGEALAQWEADQQAAEAERAQAEEQQKHVEKLAKRLESGKATQAERDEALALALRGGATE